MTQQQVAVKQLSSVRLRPATESDIAFVFNSWLKAYRHSEFARQMQSEVYFAAQHKVIEGLFRTASITIACNADDVSQIFGYMCHEVQENVPVVHFTYVKDIYRGMGLAQTLLANAGVVSGAPFMYTHKTKIAIRYEKKHPNIYHPYLAFHAFGAS